jgi:L-rhamnose mutarotase
MRLRSGAEERYDELHRDPINIRWQAEVAPLMEKAHDYSGESSDRLPVIFELGR